jgi:prephenate dehydratase
MADMNTRKRIVYQGEPGSYSQQACADVYPGWEAVGCDTFQDCFQAVQDGKAAHAMIALENSLAGRVADVHHLLPGSSLSIVGEYFLPIRFQMMAVKGATTQTIKTVEAHVMGLGQCRKVIRELGLKTVVAADNAGAARAVADSGDVTRAALASEAAAALHGLEILRRDAQDADHNTTRFVILSKGTRLPARGVQPCITSFVFRVRNLPAALYKALGGFATNGVNMTKLESYMLEGQFYATMFYADVEGHIDDPTLRRAFDEMRYFCREVTLLGTYPAHPFRDHFRESVEAPASAGF